MIEKAQAATVTICGVGWYQVKTANGGSQRVVSGDTWAVGARVLILAGSIIGPAALPKDVHVFEV